MLNTLNTLISVYFNANRKCRTNSAIKSRPAAGRIATATRLSNSSVHYTPTRAVIEGVTRAVLVAVTLLFQLLAMFSCFTMYAICQPALDTRKQFVIATSHAIVSLIIINRLFPMLNTIWLK